MQIWAGLGNPGDKYQAHRHNVGFMAVDAIAEEHDFSPWKKQFRGLTAEGRIGGKKVVLLKPLTYMNESGGSVRAALDFYKLGEEDLTVFHDELDLAPMKVKVRIGGGLAGHNGLRSINKHLGPDFRRVRIGIGHPGSKERVHGHVLGNYHKTEIDDLGAMLVAMALEAHWLAKGEDARFMNDVALRCQS
ncbi:aminoacyl-tRNA hydrolase [Sphingomicrobium marinum]|uniref:aminoacyl-tRNA hydrolase n=1 Tax=Sphingomicrobium marinum TaxID=1227950 RepID=UPI00223EE91D|nr:aminoacyl-tRNA hydrolase [Sphingomicrobium marinum]